MALAKEVFKEYVVRDDVHPTLPKGWQTIYEFENGYRASVVSGRGIFHVNEQHPYEMMVTNADYNDGDPFGYLDEFDLIGKLNEVKQQEKLNGDK